MKNTRAYFRARALASASVHALDDPSRQHAYERLAVRTMALVAESAEFDAADSVDANDPLANFAKALRESRLASLLQRAASLRDDLLSPTPFSGLIFDHEGLRSDSAR